jgi:hypothetical protein
VRAGGPHQAAAAAVCGRSIPTGQLVSHVGTRSGTGHIGGGGVCLALGECGPGGKHTYSPLPAYLYPHRYGAGGQVEEVVCIGTDFTARKRHEYARSSFLASLSHELRYTRWLLLLWCAAAPPFAALTCARVFLFCVPTFKGLERNVLCTPPTCAHRV